MTEPLPPSENGAPPIFGSWNRLYALVLGGLLLCVACFRFFSWFFS